MENLKIEHLSPYLPYGLNCMVKCEYEPYIGEMTGFNNSTFKNHVEIASGSVYTVYNPFDKITDSEYVKPILRPLSDLTKEIEHKGEQIIPLYRLMSIDRAFNLSFIETFGYEELKVSVYEMLLEMHFDVFGLIDAGLAIDINTI